MLGGYGPFDLKTRTGRLILANKIKKKSEMDVRIPLAKFIQETMFSLNIKRRCGNYHNLLRPSRWKCRCKW